jgi:signal transduction histidine kinase
MVALKEPNINRVSPTQFKAPNLHLKSTLEDLCLYEFQVECSHLGREVAQTFQNNKLLPGVILTERGQFVGMISRRRFLEQMSRPYGLELFLKRPLYSLYRFVNTEVLRLKGETPILDAAHRSLERPAEMLYEPIVVELAAGTYRLLDVHQLLIAQAQLHELTSQLLNEQTQAQLIQSEKMASLGQMIASVAHEIKNPVSCITGNFEFLSSYSQQLIEILATYEAELTKRSKSLTSVREDYDLDFILEDLPKVLKSMELGSERLLKIVGGLQYFSHLDESRRQPADIHECIDNTLVILNNRLKKVGIQVIKQYGNLPVVSCYSGQLSQVFMNMISNATDALTEKLSQPTVDFTWQPRVEITTHLLQEAEGDWVSIRIADNGVGMSPEIQERIFEMFFTTKPVGKGTGLGLTISHQIITQKHGGELILHSQPETGTEFHILLPLL